MLNHAYVYTSNFLYAALEKKPLKSIDAKSRVFKITTVNYVQLIVTVRYMTYAINSSLKCMTTFTFMYTIWACARLNTLSSIMQAACPGQGC